MTGIHAWAARWQVPPHVLSDLLCVLGVGMPDTPDGQTAGQSEASVQSARMLRAPRFGGRLWRNNSGACTDDTGRLIRYGLGNSSAQTNKVFKSSDLIGITPTVCQCGHRYGVFTAEEVKKPGWKLRPSDERGQAQFNFIKLVVSLGGSARFVTGAED